MTPKDILNWLDELDRLSNLQSQGSNTLRGSGETKRYPHGNLCYPSHRKNLADAIYHKFVLNLSDEDFEKWFEKKVKQIKVED